MGRHLRMNLATIEGLSNCIRKCNGVMASMIIKGRDGRPRLYTRTIPPTTFNSDGNRNETRSRATNPFLRQLAKNMFQHSIRFELLFIYLFEESENIFISGRCNISNKKIVLPFREFYIYDKSVCFNYSLYSYLNEEAHLK